MRKFGIPCCFVVDQSSTERDYAVQNGVTVFFYQRKLLLDARVYHGVRCKEHHIILALRDVAAHVDDVVKVFVLVVVTLLNPRCELQ